MRACQIQRRLLGRWWRGALPLIGTSAQTWTDERLLVVRGGFEVSSVASLVAQGQPVKLLKDWPSGYNEASPFPALAPQASPLWQFHHPGKGLAPAEDVNWLLEAVRPVHRLSRTIQWHSSNPPHRKFREQLSASRPAVTSRDHSLPADPAPGSRARTISTHAPKRMWMVC